MRAPKWFINEMKAFDSELRVRWSIKMNVFQLERRIANSKIIDTSKTDSFDDDYVRAKDGYILVALIDSRSFNRSIFTTLRECDLWTKGGWEAMAAHIEDLEAREEAQKWEVFSNEIKDHTKELYDFLKIRDGRTVLLNTGGIR